MRNALEKYALRITHYVLRFSKALLGTRQQDRQVTREAACHTVLFTQHLARHAVQVDARTGRVDRRHPLSEEANNRARQHVACARGSMRGVREGAEADLA